MVGRILDLSALAIATEAMVVAMICIGTLIRPTRKTVGPRPVRNWILLGFAVSSFAWAAVYGDLALDIGVLAVPGLLEKPVLTLLGYAVQRASVTLALLMIAMLVLNGRLMKLIDRARGVNHK